MVATGLSYPDPGFRLLVMVLLVNVLVDGLVMKKPEILPIYLIRLY